MLCDVNAQFTQMTARTMWMCARARKIDLYARSGAETHRPMKAKQYTNVRVAKKCAKNTD